MGEGGRAGSPVVREVTKKSSAESNKSASSKPGSREGRTIKVINNLDHSQEVREGYREGGAEDTGRERGREGRGSNVR